MAWLAPLLRDSGALQTIEEEEEEAEEEKEEEKEEVEEEIQKVESHKKKKAKLIPSWR